MENTTPNPTPSHDRQLDGVCLTLKTALDAISLFQRRFFPPQISELRDPLLPFKETLGQARREIGKIPMPAELKEPAAIISESIDLVLRTLEAIFEAPVDDFQQTVVRIMRSFRKICQVQEKLYAIRRISPYLNGIFLEPGTDSLEQKYHREPRPDFLTGLNHFGVDGEEYARGAMSLYVPEWYDPDFSWPVVVALHGGYGHGRDFIWTWLREARTRGFILVAPTSKGMTWSILDTQIDGKALFSTIDFLKQHYHFNMDRILLTGISDGGTFALLLSSEQNSPFTAYAPVAGVLAPMHINHTKGKRIYWVHGALDWMFPVQIAEQGCRVLESVGADVTLHVIEDLSHTYPREENDRILKWFDPTLAHDFERNDS